MIKYIDKGTARQHLTDRLIESALANVGFREDADAVFLDIAKNRLPVWLDELPTYDVAEVKRGRWLKITNDWVEDAQYMCSCCGRLITVHGTFTEHIGFSYPYCHCGAKMDEVDE